MGQATRHQHYVPQFFLKGFSLDSNRLFAINKGKNRIYKTSVSEACTKRDLYENRLSKEARLLLDDPRFATNAIEHKLSNYERNVSPGFKSFVTACTSGRISCEEIKAAKPMLFELVFHLLQRNPVTIRDNLALAPDMAREVLAQGKRLFANMRLFSEAAAQELGTIAAEQAILQASIFDTSGLAETSEALRSLLTSSLVILTAPIGTSFITANVPLSAYVVEDKILYVLFPFSSRCLALFNTLGNKDDVCRIGCEEVDDLNRTFLFFNPVWKIAYAPTELALQRALNKDYA